ncbi:radical SAM protein [Escherichia coli]
MRLSITDVCNFRCTYCLPDGYKPSGSTNKGFLTVDEIRRVTRAFASLGTEKVRLTGGEPSLRRDFTDIIAAVRENDAIRQIAVTTNGYRLERDVANWRDADLLALTSVSTVWTPASFTLLPGRINLTGACMAGIDAAFEVGFEKVKVNTGAMRDVNHHQLDTFLNWIQHRPIQLRFIELMETGDRQRELFLVSITSLVRFCVTSYCVAAGSTNYVNAATVPRKSFAIQITPERLALRCRIKSFCGFPSPARFPDW